MIKAAIACKAFFVRQLLMVLILDFLKHEVGC